ncbi:MAG: hypothetical protein IRZ09_11040 [Variibacter sp.]|nr:hypothetical protein [Variibacter sp.]
MPTLEFKGRPFVYSHHLSVPFRELIVDPKKSLPPKLRGRHIGVHRLRKIVLARGG